MTPTFLDLFSGAGGLSYGLRAAGWHHLLATDIWHDAALTYRRNFGERAILEADIKHLDPRALRAQLDDVPTWIVGGPPCQGFSTVGKREREDPRNQLVREFARVVRALRPEGFLVENVVGLRDMQFVGTVTELFSSLGYRVTSLVVTAADYGVPQLRRRILFIGDRDGRVFLPPPPSHRPALRVTVWDAIGDLPELAPGASATEYDKPAAVEYQRRMRRGSDGLQGHDASTHPASLIRAISFIPDGGNRQSIPNRYQPRSGFHNSYSRLHSASPAVAVTQNMGKPSGTRCIHPFQHRGLTAREGARLQGFPDRYHFVGGMISQRIQIANAVSPILAEALGRALVNPSNWTSGTGGAVRIGENLALPFSVGHVANT